MTEVNIEVIGTKSKATEADSKVTEEDSEATGADLKRLERTLKK